MAHLYKPISLPRDVPFLEVTFEHLNTKYPIMYFQPISRYVIYFLKTYLIIEFFKNWTGLGSNGTGTLTDAELQRLCPALAAKNAYRRVGRMLGVRDRDIDIIREETRGDPKESAFQTLKKWTELKGNDATRQQLSLALGRIERQDLVDVITTSNNPTSRN